MNSLKGVPNLRFFLPTTSNLLNFELRTNQIFFCFTYIFTVRLPRDMSTDLQPQFAQCLVSPAAPAAQTLVCPGLPWTSALAHNHPQKFGLAAQQKAINRSAPLVAAWMSVSSGILHTPITDWVAASNTYPNRLTDSLQTGAVQKRSTLIYAIFCTCAL